MLKFAPPKLLKLFSSKYRRVKEEMWRYHTISGLMMATVEIIDILCDFLEVAIHYILYTKKLYPATIFVPRKKYGVTVYQSEHPLVNEYITQVLKAAKFHALNKQLKQIVLCIKYNKQIVEKYIFDILQFENKHPDKDPLLVQLEQTLRSVCLKLSNSEQDGKLLSSNLEFDIVLHTTEFSVVAFNEEQDHNDFPWLSINDIECKSFGITPIHSINSERLVMQLYLEEYNNT